MRLQQRESNLEPQIRPSKRGEEIQEYRVNGRLYKITVKPKVGPEYHLIDDDGSGAMETHGRHGPTPGAKQLLFSNGY